MLRPRRRAAGLAFGAILLFVVGTSVQAGWLLVLSSVLLGACVAGALLPIRIVRKIDVERRAPPRVSQGDEVAVDLIAVNCGRGIKLGLEVEDRHVAAVRVAIPALGPGERVVIGTARRAARRGRNESTSVTVRSAAPFGVAERQRTVVVPGTTLVHPKVVRLGPLPMIDALPTHEHAIHTAPRRGTGPEYLSIREYRTGDSMRHVHWPSTARHDALMVREFEQERTRRLAIVVDTSADAGEEDTPLDSCCSVAASVAFAALGRGRGVRLLAARGGRLEVLARAEPPRILEWLAELRPFGGLALADVLRELGPHLRGVETLLVVLPTWRANATGGFVDAVSALCGNLPRVTLVLVDAESFEPDRRAPALGSEEVDRLELAANERGASVYRLRAGEDLASCLSKPYVRAD
ncbi:MAG: DUF58 domain-containing protein [Actinomycetota bacterium]